MRAQRWRTRGIWEVVKCDLRSSLHDDGIADDSCYLSNGSAGR
jgi:hypothetical protein